MLSKHSFISIGLLFGLSALSFSQSSLNKGDELDKYISAINPPAMTQIIAEDEIEDAVKEIPFRFGIPIDNAEDLNLSSEIQVNNGRTTLRRIFHAPGAISMNFNFTEFELPSGASFVIYSLKGEEQLGPYNESQNRISGEFSTSLIFSDSVLFEVRYPSNSVKPKLKLEQVVYGYRDVRDEMSVFGESGNCNININCPEGQPWTRQKQAVVMILTANQSRICTGTMINNVSEDATPYLLSANHCPVASNNVFIFNYESALCSPSTDSSLNHAISGATILARNRHSDFSLLELSSAPPTNFNVYYAGWDRQGIPPFNSVGIHHPRGDVKKISLDYDPPTSSGYYSPGQSHWKVGNWEKGTTENASSGSALFNDAGRIIGQLHGGDAACERPDEEDYYGKFSVSWDHDSDISKQLKHWLDPDGTGATSLNGWDPATGISDYDLANLGLENFESTLCGANSIFFRNIIKNRGNNKIDSLRIKYYFNNILVHEQKWQLGLVSGAVQVFQSTNIPVTSGHYQVKTEVEILGQSDAETGNNAVTSAFDAITNSIDMAFILQNDDDGDEVSWELLSSNGTIIISGGDYESIDGGEFIREDFCLSDGCFDFTIYDSYGDGICCTPGNIAGYYALINLTSGDTVFSNFNFGNDKQEHFFCLGDSCDVRSRAYVVGSSSSTAADGSIEVEVLSGFAPFTFSWTNGANTSFIDQLTPGIYGVEITDSLNCSDSAYYEVGIGTGINESSELEEILLFPNPASDNIQLENLNSDKILNYQIYDTRGRMLKSGIMNSENSSIDVYKLPEGMYFLTILSDSDIQTLRFIKN